MQIYFIQMYMCVRVRARMCEREHYFRSLVFTVQTLLYFEYSHSFPSLRLQLHLIVDVHDKMVTTLYLSFTIAALAAFSR